LKLIVFWWTLTKHSVQTIFPLTLFNAAGGVVFHIACSTRDADA
jgi:hypothetical protein